MSADRARAEEDAVLWAECEDALQAQHDERERRAAALAVLALARRLLAGRRREADAAADALSSALDRMIAARAALQEATKLVEQAARLYARGTP